MELHGTWQWLELFYQLLRSSVRETCWRLFVSLQNCFVFRNDQDIRSHARTLARKGKNKLANILIIWNTMFCLCTLSVCVCSSSSSSRIFISFCSYLCEITGLQAEVYLCTIASASGASGKEKSNSELWGWVKARCTGCHSVLGVTTLFPSPRPS